MTLTNKLAKAIIFSAIALAVLPEMTLAATMAPRELKITGNYLLVPVRASREPGAKTPNKGNVVTVRVEGQVVHEFGAILATKPEQVQYWASLDMSEFVGKTATLSVRGTLQENVLALFESSDTERFMNPMHSESGRPQVHFSQKQGWNNDVNGMVYADGLYHLSWQCNPVGLGFGNMYWGHATSKDLVHWEELSPIIRISGGKTRDGKVNANIHRSMAVGQAFSGSAVVDHHNTLGKQAGKAKTLIACFTDTGAGVGMEKGICGESLAFSSDKGRTYTLLRDYNPILSHVGRDPKLFWYEPGQCWCIVVYNGGHSAPPPVGWIGKMEFYSSRDLRAWTKESETDEVFHECPEFVELPVDGNPENKKWMLFDATPKYQVGTFDRKKFTPEFQGTRQTLGGSIKAAQCFSDAPDGRAICMVWSRANYGSDAPFSQGFTLPIELTLKTTADGIRCYANPVQELDALRDGELLSITDKKLAAGVNTLPLPAPEELIELQLTLKVTGAPNFALLRLGDIEISYAFAKKEFPRQKLAVFDRDNGTLDLHIYVDRATVEVFAKSGAVYFLEGRKKPGAPLEDLKVTVEGGSTTIASLKAFRLKSIWRQK